MLNRILTALFLLSLPLAAQVSVTCIPEPAQFKNTVQFGCDIQNQGAAAVTLGAAEIRRQSLQYLAAPLRPTAAAAQIAELNKRSFWGWVVVVIKWAGFGWSVAQGFIPEESLNDLGRMLPGGVSGGLTLADAFIGKNKEDLVVPGDYLPESITLAPSESESYTLLAMPQTSVKAFTVALGAPLTTHPAVPGFMPGAQGLAPPRRQQDVVVGQLDNSTEPQDVVGTEMARRHHVDTFIPSTWLVLYRDSQARSVEVIERWRAIDQQWLSFELAEGSQELPHIRSIEAQSDCPGPGYDPPPCICGSADLNVCNEICSQMPYVVPDICSPDFKLAEPAEPEFPFMNQHEAEALALIVAVAR